MKRNTNKTAPSGMSIERVEPPCWWIGMKTRLQLMIYGRNLSGATVTVSGEGLHIPVVHSVENPAYLFIDVDIKPEARPGQYVFTIRRDDQEVSFDFRLYERRKGSSERKSFDASDLVYLLMPDRFANGDPSLDNAQPGGKKVDRKDPFARHGGDLQGIMDHLDYLEDLGVTTLWIAPFQLDMEEQSYHGYACADYYQTDPRYGTNEKYRELVAAAHEKGIKVIMDVVLNHCGKAHWWMKSLPFREWIHQQEGEFVRSTYRLVSLTDPSVAPGDLKKATEGWFDVNMPDIALENPFVLQYFLQVYIWWVEWADLDGLRVDTFPYNDRYAAAEWTQKIREEYPNLRIVAECWHSSPAVVAYWDGDAINHDGYCSHLPSVMDFPLQEAINKGLANPQPNWDTGMNVVYEALAHDFMIKDPRTLLIFLDNHDVGRFADTVKGNAAKIKIGLVMLATLRGIPQLYYGTEYGFRTSDPTKGDGGARIDFPGGWPGDRKNLFTGKNRNRKEEELYTFARQLFQWRKTAPVIHWGKTLHYLPNDGTYAYFRYTDEQAVLVLLNPTPNDRDVNWKRFQEQTKNYAKGWDVLTGRMVRIGKKATVAAHSFLILEMRH